jgi:hypothetical protein
LARSDASILEGAIERFLDLLVHLMTPLKNFI